MAVDVLQVSPAGQNAPVTENPLEKFMKTMPDPNGAPDATGTGGQGWRADVLNYAKQFVNTPYKWGGNGPLGFDCSGFVQYVYQHFGVNLPRVSYQQANSGKRIAVADAQPGDIIAWDLNGRNQGADHVALYLGNGQIIAAPKAGDVVKIEPIWGNPYAVSMNGVK